jgi:hypothetical protein
MKAFKITFNEISNYEISNKSKADTLSHIMQILLLNMPNDDIDYVHVASHWIKSFLSHIDSVSHVKKFNKLLTRHKLDNTLELGTLLYNTQYDVEIRIDILSFFEKLQIKYLKKAGLVPHNLKPTRILTGKM